MEMLFWFIIVLAVYITAVIVAVHFTVDKWKARSGLFGVGLVHIVMGFLLDRLVTMRFYDYWDYESMGIYYVANYAFLIMGISGIVMVAVDLLKSVKDLRSYVSRENEKQSSPGADQKTAESRSAAPQGNIPTWKRMIE